VMNTESQLKLNIAEEFSKTPGPRTRAEGEYSAEQFLKNVLVPRFDAAIAHGEVLLIDLDGGYGYATSFLEEAFGGLARLRGVKEVLGHIDFKSEDEPYLKSDTLKYIREAETGTRRRK